MSIAPNRALPRIGRASGILALALLAVLAACDDSTTNPPTSKEVTLALSADVGGGEAGRSIAVRAYYRGDGGDEIDLEVDPATIAVTSGSTAAQSVTVDVLPCLNDQDREVAAGTPATSCRVHVALRLLAPNGTMVSEDETIVAVSPTATSVTVAPFELPAGALTPSAASLEFDMLAGGQLPPAATVTIGSSTALQAGPLSSSVEYLSGTGWLVVTIPTGTNTVTIAPATTTIAPGEYEAIVRVTSALMFTPAEIHVELSVSHPPRQLTVTMPGSGPGTVTSSPVGIACTAASAGTTGTCTASFDHGTTVVLSATPGEHATFAGWSGGACTGTGTCTVTMTEARSVTATMQLQQYPLTVTPVGLGTVSPTPAPTCITEGTCGYPAGTLVTITATAGGPSGFNYVWVEGLTGDCTQSGNQSTTTLNCVVQMDGPKSVTATFAARMTTAIVSGAGTGSGHVVVSPSVSPDHCVITGGVASGNCTVTDRSWATTMTFTAVPAAGSVFTGWSGCPNSPAGASGEVCTFTGLTIRPLELNYTLVASFAPTPVAPASITAASDNPATAVVGSILRPAVVVRDINGTPVPGIPVTFRLGAFPVPSTDHPGPSLADSVVISDGSGIARVGAWTIGSKVGSYTLVAAAPDLPSVALPLTALPDIPAQLIRDLRTSLQCPRLEFVPGGCLGEQIIAVWDRWRNPVPGATVHFGTAFGPEPIVVNPLTSTVTAGSTGIASLGIMRADCGLGVHSLGVSSGDVRMNYYTPIAQGGPAAQITIVDGNNQTAPGGTALPILLAVRLVDGCGVPSSGQRVIFGPVSQPEEIVTTDANGVARRTTPWVLSPIAGLQSIFASPEDWAGRTAGAPRPEVRFIAFATAPPE